MPGRRWVGFLLEAGVLALLAGLVFSCGGRGARKRTPLLDSATITPIEAKQKRKTASVEEIIEEVDALLPPEGVSSEVFERLKEEFKRFVSQGRNISGQINELQGEARLESIESSQAGNIGDAKVVSAPPKGQENKVLDLRVFQRGKGNLVLTWSYRNQGDYNQDGIADVADIAVLAEHLFHRSPASGTNPSDILDEVIDTNGDGQVEIGDVAVLSEHLFNEVDRYLVMSSDSSNGRFDEVGSVAFSESWGAGRKRFRTTFELTPGKWYKVVPVDRAGETGAPSNAVQAPSFGDTTQPPIGVFTASPAHGTAPLTVSFDASQSYDPDGEIKKFTWDFEGDLEWDFESETSALAEHTYTEAGDYLATLLVTDDAGITGSAFTRIIVNESGENSPPIAAVSANPSSGEVPLEVHFDASGSVDTDGFIVRYEWDFDGDSFWDLDTGGEPTATYTYTEPGNFTASCKVTDNDGGMSVAQVGITAVQPQPPPAHGRGDWWMLGRDARHSARSSFIGAQSPILFQKISLAPGADAGPVYDLSGTFYVAENRRIYAFLPTGELKFLLEIPGSAIEGIAVGEDGTIYATGNTGDSSLTAVSAEGKILWSIDLGTPAETSPAIGEDGTIYFGGENQKLYAVNPDGTLKWELDAGNLIRGNPAIGNGETIYTAVFDDEKDAYNLLAISGDGNLLWETRVFNWGDSRLSPRIVVMDDGTIGVAGADLVYVSPDGTVKWSFTEGTVVSAAGLRADNCLYVPVEYSDGNQYYDYLYLFDSAGNAVWRHRVLGQFRGELAVGSDGVCYFGTWDNEILAVNPDGTLRWKYQLDYPPDRGPVIPASGVTVVVGLSNIYIFKSESAQAPVAVLTATPEIGDEPLTVTLDASASYDPNGTIVHYWLDLDGSGSFALDRGQDPIFEYTYDEPGIFKASLRVLDDEGVYGEASVTITVIQTRWSISGHISPNLENAEVRLEPGGLAVRTDSRGNFFFDEIPNGTYTVTPYGNNWRFDPPEREVVVNSEDVTGVDFAGIWLGGGGRGDWFMFGRDPLHTRRSPAVGPKNGNLKWRSYIGYGYYTSPAISSSAVVYVGGGYSYYGGASRYFAINPDGSIGWERRIGGWFTTAPAIADDGTIYVAGDGLIALNPDGSVKWKYGSGQFDYNCSPVVGFDGTIYMAWFGGGIYALDRDGGLKWKYKTGSWVSSSPAITVERNVLVGDGNGNIYAFRYDGEILWTFKAGASIHSTPAYDLRNFAVYVGCDDSYVYALDSLGNLKWRYKTGGAVYSSPGIASDGSIYVGSRDGYLYALTADGSLRWRYFVGDMAFGSPAIDTEDSVYIGSLTGNIYGLDKDGRLLFSYSTEDAISGSPALDIDGTLYVASRDGYLYALAD